jgi:integrase/recombinase XerD
MNGSIRTYDGGALSGLVEGFRAHAFDRGYAPSTVRLQVKAVRALGRWMSSNAMAPGDLSTAALTAFRDDRRAVGYRRVPGVGGFRLLTDYLVQAGFGLPEPAVEPDPAEELLAEYRRWLLAQRGLAATTICAYAGTAGAFLRSLPQGPSGPAIRELSASDVTEFLLTSHGRLSVGTVRTQVNHVRVLLRFLHVTGIVDADLASSVPSVAGWRDTGIPRGVTPETVAAMIDSCDAMDGTQVRDRAILLLVARLGLRSIEVARLELGDIDWRAGEVTVRGKGRRRDVLPLPADAGQGLVDYLRQARGPSPFRQVFLTRRAPRRPIEANLVHDVVRRACRRAGVPVVGAHRLRHGLATQMLAAGVPLASVSQVLRHADIATTAIYAKVDVAMLGGLARPWPVAAS